MKIDVGEGTRAAGAAEDHNHNPIHGYGGSTSASARSDALLPGSNRAVVQQQAASFGGVAGGVHAAGGTRLTSVAGGGVGGGEGGGRGDPNLVALSVQHGSTSDTAREQDRRPIVGRDEFSQEDGGVAAAGREAVHLAHDTNLAPPEENGSPGSGTPPTDTGGDPCPSCASPPPPLAPRETLASGVAEAAVGAVDPSLLCRCGDKARGGHTGGEPVAAADAVARKAAGGGSAGRAYPGGQQQQQQQQQQTRLMVATEAAGGGGGRDDEAQAAAAAAVEATRVVKLTTTTAAPVSFQQYVDPRLSVAASVSGVAQQPVAGNPTAMMVVGAGDPVACVAGDGAAVRAVGPVPGVAENGDGGSGGGGGESWSVRPPLEQGPASTTPRASTALTAVTNLRKAADGGLQQQIQLQLQQQQIEALQADTMDRLAQSLAQAQQLALSVEARQTELLARPKRRSHPSAKQESATQSRKVRPKSMPQASKLPKLEDLGIKVEPAPSTATAAAAAATAAGNPAVAAKTTRATQAPATTKTTTTPPASAAAAAEAGGAPSSGLLMPKQRLLIKIPRAAVTAATAHAAEVAAAAKKEDGEAKTTKRGKGKSGVKRARPLAGTRAPPPPPPPAPTSRQELPPGCGPPSPSLKGIFLREMDEEELATAQDGSEHLQTSQASRRLTALSAATPKELASHVQALRLDYLVQKVRPILTKLMSSGTGPQRGLFNVPVDPLKLGIPDYFKRVPHPMDLGTIKSRLLSMSYTTPEDFASDVRLVFKNAIGFNPEAHFVHTWAVQLLSEFDQEFSKQIGKLDEGWAKSLSHACQLCQGQTCALCGDKCLKLEPPVIICHHCNKRVVRGGVYHITRDGCRLWCSRCHPGLPPELPTDGDPEALAADETAEGGGGGGGGSTGGDGTGGAGGAEDGDAAPGESGATTAEGETTPPKPSPPPPPPPPQPSIGNGSGVSNGGAASELGSAAGAASSTPSLPPPSEAPPAPQTGTAAAQPPAVPTPVPPAAASLGCAAVRDGHGSATGGGGRECRTAVIAGNGPATAAAGVAEAVGSANHGGETETAAAGAVAPAPSNGSGGEGGSGGSGGGAVVAVEEVKAPLKRDLLRRKFDEEISEPWVQCDRCNSWVHQVCALFNARANVGEARFVCPLCRLRNVVTEKPPTRTGSAEITAEGDAGVARKRPKSIDGNGRLLPPPCPVKQEQPPAEAEAKPPTTPPKASNGPPPATAEGRDRAPPVLNGAVNGAITAGTGGEPDRHGPVGIRPAAAAAAAGGTAATEGVVSGLPATTSAAAPSSSAAVPSGGAVTTSSLEPSPAPAEGSPPPAAHTPAVSKPLPTPSPQPPPATAVAAVNGGAVPVSAAATPVIAGSSGSAPPSANGGGGEGAGGGTGADAGATAVARGSGDQREGAAERAGVKADGGGDPAAVAAAAPTAPAPAVRDPMEVDEDVGAEAAGDAASGSASADNLNVYAASSLPHTPLSRYIEARVKQRLSKLENDAAADTLSIRLISNVEATCEVHAVLRETFCCKDGHGVGPKKNDVPELLKYRSKALSMFQRVDGVEVCLFSMYVQEYGADAPYFNARRAYISYLDSVEYFRPRKHRTAVYHEILVAYLDWLRRRGFKAAHIWSCPPQRGNNFIFWCHPLHQKTPTRDRLSGWYGNMLKRAVQLGVAAKVTTLDKTHFAEVERIGILLKNRRTSAAASAAASLAGVKGPDDLPLRPEIPVIFEGDFWAEEAVRLARAVERRDDGMEETQTPLELCRQALEELIRHQQGAPFTAPVDPARDRCPDYLVVIEQPMDLGTVAETLDAMKYHDAGAFVSDVRLIFDNARKYNPPKHPIHVAAAKLAKVFDKTVRALENAVNRLPGMHEMGLEHLLLEEPAPAAPATPVPAPATPGGGGDGVPAPAVPPRPTAPGKRSIPWAFDAIGPLSALARKTWAAHSARTARAVGTLPSMSESSPVEVGMPSTIPACRGGSVGGAGSDPSSHLDAGPSSAPSSASTERLSRSGSTSVMSVSEFYGPSGARMLQRRGSSASQQSLADSYGEGESLESASVTKENKEGQAALSSLMADGEQQQQQQQAQAAQPKVAEAPPQPSPSPSPSPPIAGAPSAWSALTWPPGQQQAFGAVTAAAAAAAAAVGAGLPGRTATAPASFAAAATPGAPEASQTAVTGMTAAAAPAAAAGAVSTAPQNVAGVAGAAAPSSASPSPGLATTPAPGSSATAGFPSVAALPGAVSGGGGRADSSPPPLTLDAPHPAASGGVGAGGASLLSGATTAAPAASALSRPGGSSNGGPASSLSLPWSTAPAAAPAQQQQQQPSAVACQQEPLPADQQQQQQQHGNQRTGLLRAMSVDSASSPTRPRARTSSFTCGSGGGGGSEGLSRSSAANAGSGSEAFGITVQVPSGSLSLGRSKSGGGGCGPHSPRLRAKSMDSGGRKGKSKRGKGPGVAVMGKADRIGRMLQSLSRAVTRISKDLLVVTLGRPDKPANPPAARAGAGMTKETMMAELEAWHASSGLDGVLTPDCHDPDPPISRALVDARHTFLEMCQFRHYQFDTLRRAKHSSAMVLYHLHRPESRSLNPFCSRCHRPVRFVRYHCGVCNYDLCAECDEDVGTKCEDGHPLTPYRVTFSTEDAEKSPAPGRTPATGGTNLSPRRSPVRERGGSGSVGRGSPTPTSRSGREAAAATVSDAIASAAGAAPAQPCSPARGQAGAAVAVTAAAATAAAAAAAAGLAATPSDHPAGGGDEASLNHLVAPPVRHSGGEVGAAAGNAAVGGACGVGEGSCCNNTRTGPSAAAAAPVQSGCGAIAVAALQPVSAQAAVAGVGTADQRPLTSPEGAVPAVEGGRATAQSTADGVVDVGGGEAQAHPPQSAAPEAPVTGANGGSG